jgi:predicted phage tail protein
MDDLRADFRAIYHITEDIENLEAIQFQRFAYRTPAYKGVMRAKIEKEQDDKEQVNQTQQRMAGGEDARQVPGNRAALQLSPTLAGVIDFK